MFELQRLRRDHAQAVLDFEQVNRAYFAKSISDRGDDFFENFAERFGTLLAEQEAGARIYHVLVDEHKTVDQMKQEKILAPWAKWSGGFIDSDKFIETLYNSLTGSKGQFLKHN